MAIYFNGRFGGSFARISGRIRQVQKGARKPSWLTWKSWWVLHHRKLQGVASLLVSVVLGFWAHESSQFLAILNWEKHFIPSSSIIQFAFQSYGFQPVRDLKSLQKLSRGLPAQLDEKGSFWISQNENWVVYFDEGEGLSQPKIFCFRCQTLPDGWGPVAQGWRGFQDVLKIIEKISAQSKNPIQRSVVPRDPRELIY